MVKVADGFGDVNLLGLGGQNLRIAILHERRIRAGYL